MAITLERLTRSRPKWLHDNEVSRILLNCNEGNTQISNDIINPWWRHQMETFSALLAICAGNSPVAGEFRAQRPVTRSFYVFCGMRLLIPGLDTQGLIFLQSNSTRKEFKTTTVNPLTSAFLLSAQVNHGSWINLVFILWMVYDLINKILQTILPA